MTCGSLEFSEGTFSKVALQKTCLDSPRAGGGGGEVEAQEAEEGQDESLKDPQPRRVGVVKAMSNN